MVDRFDVVVVGARVAGSSLATHLARAGLSVCLVDRAKFPSDTLSTHVIQNLDAFRRLGIFDRILATGAPLLTEIALGMTGVMARGSFPDLAMLCVRRPALDQVLLDNAVEAGVEARTATRVTGVLEEDGGRVAGVRTKDATGVVSALRAPLVVGADGRNSTVARLVGARRYNVVNSERAGVWAYYEGVDAPAGVTFYRTDEDLWGWCPTDGGAFIVIVGPSSAGLPAYREGEGAGFDRMVAACEPLAGLVAGARRIRKPIVVARWQGYYRESAAPGWTLVGDAGHFKDPTPGLGISDALRQAERLADFVVAGFRGDSPDEQLRAWWSWRDREAAEAYWFAQDFGRAGGLPPVAGEMFRGLLERPDGLRTILEVLHRKRAPSKMFSPADLLGACGRLLVRRAVPPRQVFAEVRGTLRLARQHRRLDKHPRVRGRRGGVAGGRRPRYGARLLTAGGSQGCSSCAS